MRFFYILHTYDKKLNKTIKEISCTDTNTNLMINVKHSPSQCFIFKVVLIKDNLVTASSLGIRWRMGTQVLVFLHDYKLSREAFTRPEFVDRPDWLVFNFKEEKTLGELLQRFLKVYYIKTHLTVQV